MERPHVKGETHRMNPAGMALLVSAALLAGLLRARTASPPNLYESLGQIFASLPQHPAWLVGLTLIWVMILSTIVHDLHGWLMGLNPLRYDWKARLWYATRKEEKWLVLFRNEIIASLDAPRPEDVFWTSYRLRPTTGDPVLLKRMQGREFWNHCEARGISFVTDPHRIPAPFAFPAVNAILPDDRLRLRGLELPFTPYPWDYPMIAAVRLLGFTPPPPQVAKPHTRRTPRRIYT